MIKRNYRTTQVIRAILAVPIFVAVMGTFLASRALAEQNDLPTSLDSVNCQELLVHLNIEDFAAQLRANDPSKVVVFRGQKTLTPGLFASKGSDRVQLADKYQKELKGAASSISYNIAETKRYLESYKQQGWKDLIEKQEAKYRAWSNLTSEQYLLIEHIRSPKFFVSSSDSLSIAMGNFAQSPTINYIYILQVPRDKALNVSESIRNLADNDFDFKESEWAIPLDATPYVTAIYDVKNKRVFQIRAHPKPSAMTPRDYSRVTVL